VVPSGRRGGPSLEDDLHDLGFELTRMEIVDEAQE